MNKLLFDINHQVDIPTLILETKAGKVYGSIDGFTELKYTRNLTKPNEISFTVTKYGDKNINLARKTAVLEEIEKRTKLPLNHAILTETKTNKIMNFRFKNKNSH